MKILVTGCNGQLGNEMQLLEAEHPQHTYFNTDVVGYHRSGGCRGFRQ